MVSVRPVLTTKVKLRALIYFLVAVKVWIDYEFPDLDPAPHHLWIPTVTLSITNELTE